MGVIPSHPSHGKSFEVQGIRGRSSSHSKRSKDRIIYDLRFLFGGEADLHQGTCSKASSLLVRLLVVVGAIFLENVFKFS